MRANPDTPLCSRPKCRRRVRWSGLCQPHLDVAVGRSPAEQVDSTQALRRLDLLRARGWSWPQIAKAARMGTRTVQDLHAERPATIRRRHRDALLAIVPAWQRTRTSVNPVGAQRRVRALAWMAWPTFMLDARIGLAHGSLSTMLARGMCSARVAAAVADVYDEWSGKRGPSARTATHARNAGFHPPMAWEGLDIDDPTARPDMGAPGQRRVRVDPSEVEHLRRGGVSLELAAERLRVRPDAIRRYYRDTA